MAMFDAPGIKKLRRFVWKELLESKTLLSSNILHTSSKFSENINLLFNAGGLKLGHFGICDMLFPYKKKLSKKFGHVIQAAKGLLIVQELENPGPVYTDMFSFIIASF